MNGHKTKSFDNLILSYAIKHFLMCRCSQLNMIILGGINKWMKRVAEKQNPTIRLKYIMYLLRLAALLFWKKASGPKVLTSWKCNNKSCFFWMLCFVTETMHQVHTELHTKINYISNSNWIERKKHSWSYPVHKGVLPHSQRQWNANPLFHLNLGPIEL